VTPVTPGDAPACSFTYSPGARRRRRRRRAALGGRCRSGAAGQRARRAHRGERELTPGLSARLPPRSAQGQGAGAGVPAQGSATAPRRSRACELGHPHQLGVSSQRPPAGAAGQPSRRLWPPHRGPHRGAARSPPSSHPHPHSLPGQVSPSRRLAPWARGRRRHPSPSQPQALRVTPPPLPSTGTLPLRDQAPPRTRRARSTPPWASSSRSRRSWSQRAQDTRSGRGPRSTTPLQVSLRPRQLRRRGCAGPPGNLPSSRPQLQAGPRPAP
jgi:hypothetical protein